MKWFGALVVVAYTWVAFTGWEPFSKEERGQVPSDARRGPRSIFLWTSGFHGGK